MLPLMGVFCSAWYESTRYWGSCTATEYSTPFFGSSQKAGAVWKLELSETRTFCATSRDCMPTDWARARSVGMQSRDVAQNVLVSLSSSFQTAPAFWLDPKNGVEYSVAVQEPQYRVDSYQALQNTPISGSMPGSRPQILGNLVKTSTTARPAEISHYTTQPMINVYAAVDGRDLGGVAGEVEKRVQAIEKDLPKGSHIAIRGQDALFHFAGDAPKVA